MRLSGSKLPLAARCSYFVRPEVSWLADTSGDAARIGNATHGCIEEYIATRGDVDVAKHCDAHGVDGFDRESVRLRFERWKEWAAERIRIGWRAEIPLAYHGKSDSARELASEGHRDYSDARDDEVPMTLDLFSMGEDERGPFVDVYDWKTGVGDVDVAERNMQVGVAALAAARLVGVHRARVWIVKVWEDRIDEGSPAWLDAFALDLLRHEVRRIVEHPDVEPQPGPHCHGMYCPARATCPATVADVASLARAERKDIAALVNGAITTPADAGQAYVRLKVVKDAVRAIEDRIKEVVRANGGEAPTSPGKVIRLTENLRETFSKSRLPKEIAEATLQELRDLGALTYAKSEYLREGNSR